MRGTGMHCTGDRVFQRIIPACAGNSIQDRAASAAPPDHPRVCGEQACLAYAASADAGSSPRVRGTGKVQTIRHERRRIIPACAGNRLTIRSSKRQWTDHPRVCGEQTDAEGNTVTPCGSSPRVRGTACNALLYAATLRIIPACAGNRARPQPCFGLQTDHPRVCGEQSRQVS